MASRMRMAYRADYRSSDHGIRGDTLDWIGEKGALVDHISRNLID